MQIAKNAVVTMHYRLTNDTGEEIDSSIGQEPLVFLHGYGALISGLEAALIGKAKDDKFAVRIVAKDAYGEPSPDKKIRIAKENFDNQGQIRLGARFVVDTEEGETVVTVVGVEADGVVVDANHPLAGVDLNFDVTVVDVRAATKDELKHGHVHGESCGHDH